MADLGVADLRPSRLILVRHGETEWSRTHRHTGRIDIPLTDHGRDQARSIASWLSSFHVDAVRCSPLRRAAETCELVGWGATAVVDPNLVEWDYGEYDGLTKAEIKQQNPAWRDLWSGGVVGGETLAELAERTDRVIAAARTEGGTVGLVAHGHVLRVLTSRWLGMDPSFGARLPFDTAAVSLLSQDDVGPTMVLWNGRANLSRTAF